MIASAIKNATRIIGETQDEYHSLHIRDELMDGLPTMVSAWKPTADELEMLKEGGSVHLHIIGTVHPPVMLTVNSVPEEETLQ